MFTHLAIHRPKPEYQDDLLASMNRVGTAAAGAPGLIRIDAWKELGGERLVGISTWESKDSFEAVAAKIFAVVQDDPFDLWEDKPIESMLLEHP
jgi:heme-degrading monooxygenase HmoA